MALLSLADLFNYFRGQSGIIALDQNGFCDNAVTPNTPATIYITGSLQKPDPVPNPNVAILAGSRGLEPFHKVITDACKAVSSIRSTIGAAEEEIREALGEVVDSLDSLIESIRNLREDVAKHVDVADEGRVFNSGVQFDCWGDEHYTVSVRGWKDVRENIFDIVGVVIVYNRKNSRLVGVLKVGTYP